MKLTPERIMSTRCRTEPGNVIPVIIEGHIYDSVIDESGIQRFPSNTIYDYMLNYNTHGNPVNHRDREQMHTQMLNLNTLSLAYHQRHFDKRQWLEFRFDKRQWLEFRMPGYSVSGFCDLDDFSDWHIANPLWNEGNVVINGDEITILHSRMG